MDASSDDGGFNPFIPEGEVDLEFDPLEDADDDDDSYWLSTEQDQAMRQQGRGFPKANEWKDPPLEELKHMTVTIDRGREQVFNQAKTEIIDILQKGWGEKAPSFTTLAENTFGKNSRLFRLLLIELELQYHSYCRFLATFFAACRRRVPVSQMLKDNKLDKTGLMEWNDYNKILRRIESIGGNDAVGSVGEPLWMKIEDTYNQEVKHKFLRHRGHSHLTLSLDDDKQQYNYSKNANTWGLTRTRHIQKNRFGLNLHTAATAATCIVANVAYQREHETLNDIYERMYRKMFGDRVGGGPVDLQGITLCTDRGYWTATLVFSKLLPAGADLVGTVARCFWFPFVYNKMTNVDSNNTEADKHNRTKVTTKGFRDTLYKTLKLPGNRVLRAIAYRTGTGNVSLAMSTVHDFNAYDFNTAFPKDSKWCFLSEREESNETRNRRPFRRVCGSSEYANLSVVMGDSAILPLTDKQGDAGWFQLRKFGLTSSTSNKAVEERSREIKHDHPLREQYETVLSVAGRNEWLPLEEEEEEADDLDPTTTTAAATDNDNAAAAADDDSLASYWITNIEQQTIRDEFLRDLADKNLDEETIREIVRRHKHAKPDATMTTLRKNLKGWAEQSSKLHRKYHWYNAKQLKDRIKQIDTRANTTGSKAVLLEAVVDCERKQSERDEATERGEVCRHRRCCCCLLCL